MKTWEIPENDMRCHNAYTLDFQLQLSAYLTVLVCIT